MAIHLQLGMLRHYAEYARFDPDAILQLLDQTSSVLYICTNGWQIDEKLELFYRIVEYIDETNSPMQVVCSLNMQQCEQVLFLFFAVLIEGKSAEL